MCACACACMLRYIYVCVYCKRVLQVCIEYVCEYGGYAYILSGRKDCVRVESIHR